MKTVSAMCVQASECTGQAQEATDRRSSCQDSSSHQSNPSAAPCASSARCSWATSSQHGLATSIRQQAVLAKSSQQTPLTSDCSCAGGLCPQHVATAGSCVQSRPWSVC